MPKYPNCTKTILAFRVLTISTKVEGTSQCEVEDSSHIMIHSYQVTRACEMNLVNRKQRKITTGWKLPTPTQATLCFVHLIRENRKTYFCTYIVHVVSSTWWKSQQGICGINLNCTFSSGDSSQWPTI